jgi:hypothetical protein
MFAFMALVIASGFQTTFSSKRKLDLNIGRLFTRNFWFVGLVYFMSPMLIAVIISGILSRFIRLSGIVDNLPDIVFYISGVVCAYKHDQWRRKHGLHLPVEKN